MDFIKGLIPGNANRNPNEEQASLLGDWTSYANSNKTDVEAGAASSSNLFGGASLSSAQNAASARWQDATAMVTGGLSTVRQTVTSNLPSSESFSIPSGQQLIHFFSFMAAGGVFLLLAFMVFLPLLVVAPSKFALSFTLGCLCIMAAFSSLRGWKAQLQHMMSTERLPFSATYIGSIVATLYAALIMHSYLLSLLCSFFQFLALLWYCASYFPGGADGVKFLLNLGYGAVSRLVGVRT